MAEPASAQVERVPVDSPHLAAPAHSMGAMSRLARLWRTVRWLKPVQITGRIALRLKTVRPDLRPAPARRATGGRWALPARRPSSLKASTVFRFLAEEHDLAEVGWDDPGLALLWRYNLHYFDDLNAYGSDEREGWHRALIDRWIRENAPGAGTAWAPYPTSLRIVNWVKWSLRLRRDPEGFAQSLAVQARWLHGHIEWHLLGNHLFANAKALLFAGLYFEGAEADAWARTANAILRRELPEQFLADGGHFERSPMYHALALEDVLDLVNLLEACGADRPEARTLLKRLRPAAQGMHRWLQVMSHPDGTLARFNDCAEGIAPGMDELERYGRALGVTQVLPPRGGVVALQPSGYLRWEAPGATALVDVAPIGPDYLPGHAHADTLSFELSIGTRQVIVNRGTSVYGEGPRRQFERGTACHSTVQVGAENSSEVWAGFRVGRRARPGPLAQWDGGVSCSHDGYRHLKGRPIHHRRWLFEQDGLRVEDHLDATAPVPATARYHLAPGLALATDDGTQWDILEGRTRIARLVVITGTARRTRWSHATAFGERVDAETLEVDLVEARAALRLFW